MSGATIVTSMVEWARDVLPGPHGHPPHAAAQKKHNQEYCVHAAALAHFSSCGAQVESDFSEGLDGKVGLLFAQSLKVCCVC